MNGLRGDKRPSLQLGRDTWRRQGLDTLGTHWVGDGTVGLGTWTWAEEAATTLETPY